MKTIAFFNNKGGVGKTSLVYHIAWMFSVLELRVIAVDLDPQANLSGMFLDELTLERIWQGKKGSTIETDIAPIFKGIGDISSKPHIEEISERIGLLIGDLALSNREDDLSGQWSKCMDRDERAFRVMTAFARTIRNAGKDFQADFALVDVGPNLGAINRAALIASDYVILPLAPDLFSLQGLRNVGPTLKNWQKEWRDRTNRKPEQLDIYLPNGDMKPLGYIVMRHSTRRNHPVQAYLRWIEKIPAEYRQSVADPKQNGKNKVHTSLDDDANFLALLKDYRSLMPLAQEANKPMFLLKPGDGVIGAQNYAVQDCYKDFKTLAGKIIQRIEGN